MLGGLAVSEHALIATKIRKKNARGGLCAENKAE